MTVSGTVSQHSETGGNAHFSFGFNRDVVNAITGTPADPLCWDIDPRGHRSESSKDARTVILKLRLKSARPSVCVIREV